MVLENLSDWNLAIYDWIESIISDHRCPRYNKVAENCLTLRSSSFTTSSGYVPIKVSGDVGGSLRYCNTRASYTLILAEWYRREAMLAKEIP